MDLNAQQPAEGIMVAGNWGFSRSYKVACDCGDDNHNHSLWVEAEDTGVVVTVYTEVKSPFWSMNRFRQFWELLTRGYIRYESAIIMNEQVALNYAETIKCAVKDVKDFKRNYKNHISDK